jgi:hypothetical protein
MYKFKKIKFINKINLLISMSKSGWLIGAILLTICTIFQLYGTIRYYDRIPDDMIGVGIYSLSTILFGIVAFGFFINWRKEKES